MASEIKVDTISEKTSAGGVTIDGLLIKDGNISGDVALAGTTPTFTIGDAGAEDATLLFDGNAQDYHVGLDDSSDSLVIGLGSALGTTPAMTVNASQVVTFAQNPVFPDGGVAVADLDIDGATDIGAAIVDADLFIIDDGAGGTNRKVTASRLKTYAGASGDITTIDSILNTDIKIGEDDQTKIDFETADTINFYTNNAVKMAIASTGATTIDAGDNNVTALTVTQKGGYNGIHIKGDATNTGTVSMVVDSSGTGDQYYKLQSDGAFKWQIKNDYSDSHRLWIADGSGDGVYMNQDATSWSSSSDERLKDNWTNFSNAETKINTLTKLGTHKRKVYDKVNNTVGAIKQDID